jgi:hypothetical protein
MEDTEDFVDRTARHMNDVGRERSKREKKNINSLTQLVPTPSIDLRTSPTRICSALHQEPRRFMLSKLPATDTDGV